METLKSVSASCIAVCTFEKRLSIYVEKCQGSFFVHGYHGKAEMHMHSECHLYSFKVWEVNSEGCPRPFFIDGCHGNTEMHMLAKFHHKGFHGFQVQVFLGQKVPEGIFCSWLSWKH